MEFLYIYILGVLVATLLMLVIIYIDGEINFKEFCIVLFLVFLSWIGVLYIIICGIATFIDERKDIIVWKRKDKED